MEGGFSKITSSGKTHSHILTFNYLFYNHERETKPGKQTRVNHTEAIARLGTLDAAIYHGGGLLANIIIDEWKCT